ncbi:MAG TPA: adenylate/guanylate cyclase domain-containing protein [Nocardioidaceae bacterium]|nr:adenylate/guanylate cyclase domain-containing protein [Nocardioidaceae bacterium]
MLRWDPAEVEAADALPWDMPFAQAVRPLTVRSMVQIALAGALLYTLSGVLSVGTLLTTESRETALAHPTLTVVIASEVALTGLLVLGALVFVTPAVLRRFFPVMFLVGMLGPPVTISLGVYGAGPDFGDFNTVFYIEAPLFAFYVCRLRWASLCVGLVVTCYAAVLLLQDGWPYAWGRWLLVASTVGATAFIGGRAAQRSDQLAEAEHSARTELAQVNATLEARVEAQVGEIERLGGLRRFLSPQVADLMLSDEPEALSRPHRARIAVIFCDLRGFTAFTNKAEPEEVIGVLDDYYKTVGTLLQKYGATVGDYAGDGIMAYFGDPVPHPEPAHAALRMTRDLGPAMGAVVGEWRRHGHDLDYGVGVSFGYATLGVIGFDGRYDYSPVGGVVNLAARLCAKAGPGEVLLDHATYAATEGLLPCEPVDLDLKGYTDARAYKVV